MAQPPGSSGDASSFDLPIRSMKQPDGLSDSPSVLSSSPIDTPATSATTRSPPLSIPSPNFSPELGNVSSFSQSLAVPRIGPAFTSRQLFNASPQPSRQPSPQSFEPFSSPASASDASTLASSRRASAASPRSFVFKGSSPASRPPPTSQTNDALPSMQSESVSKQLWQGHEDPFVDKRSTSNISSSSGPSFHVKVDVQCTAPRPREQASLESPTVAVPKRNEEQIVPYDVKKEEVFPSHPYFTEQFQANGLNKGIECARAIYNALESLSGHSQHDFNLRRLIADAKELSDFEPRENRTIAVLGDSGEGKSSLINSLLHCFNIAKIGDTGAACTSVVTEYHQKTSKHAAPFTIEAEHLSEEQIKENIKELVWSYERFYHPDVEEASTEDYKKYERESEVARFSITSAFGDHEDLEALLDDHSDGSEKRTVAQLTQWAEGFEWPQGGSGCIWRSTAETDEECCEKTDQFMNDRLWPFTKVIRVFLNSQVLKTGVVLVDLPGLHDVNLARVRATERYLLNCDHIFIVAKISRAVSDRSLKSSLFTALKQHISYEWEEHGVSKLNVTVVCTKSEDINEKAARKEFCGDGKLVSRRIMDELDGSIHAADRQGGSTYKKLLKLQQKMVLMEARNQSVRSGLQRAYAKEIAVGSLETVCISNKFYEKYVQKGDQKCVQASGIPELRRRCHAVTAQAQYLAAKNFLVASLPSLFNSIRIWAGTAEGHPSMSGASKTKMLEHLGQMSESAKAAVTKWRESFVDEVGKLINTTEESEHRWTEAAADASRDWDAWHHTQYSAWCHNNGTHSTPKRAFRRWNDEIIATMRAEINPEWERIAAAIPTFFQALIHRLLESVGTFQATGVIDQHGRLAKSMTLHCQRLQYSVGIVQRDFTRDFRGVHRCATEDNSNSFVLAEMLSAYRSAAREYGPEYSSRQRAIIHGQIEQEGLFEEITGRVENELFDLTSRTEATLHAKVEAAMRDITADFQMAVAKPQDGSAEARDRVRAMLAGWRSEMKRIKDVAVAQDR